VSLTTPPDRFTRFGEDNDDQKPFLQRVREDLDDLKNEPERGSAVLKRILEPDDDDDDDE
jgi:hypothetical protein